MKKVLKKGKRGNRKERLVAYEKMSSLNENSTCIELIQMLIPVGFQAIEKELQSEVSKQAGAGYTRTHHDLKRWGCNEGSVFLGDQKVPIAVFRVRDILEGKEVPATFGIKSDLSEKAVIQRCQCRKREKNIKISR